MDWTGCDLVEVIPGKVSGQPLVCGSRVPAGFILDDAKSGMTAKQIHEDYLSLPMEEIESVIAFAQKAQSAA
jgi:uncharacterized protein (DUF433 family)